MKIAVLGGGNGAYAAAADLTLKGHEVRMWRRNAEALSKTLVLKDADGERPVTLASASPDLGETLRGAELVFMPDPAFTQADNAKRIAPHLADGQVVFLAPGTRLIRDDENHPRRGEPRICLCRDGTLPWLTQARPDTAAITTRHALPTGVYPATRRRVPC
jgi:opine dehydrogenase